MMHRWSTLAFVACCALLGCATTPPPLVSSRCVDPDLQKAITFCVSPQAADLARAQSTGIPTLIPTQGAPSLGDDDAAVTLVMFSDLRCPFCQRSHRSTVQWAQRHQDVRLVFKHLPLPSHPAAVPAALGALVAAEEDKFWEFVDACLQVEGEFQPSDLKRIREEVGVSEERWMDRYGAEEHFQTIEDDLSLAQRLGVSGTPTLFVNGIRLVGEPSLDELDRVLEMQRDFARRLQASGVSSKEVSPRLTAAQFTMPTAVEVEPKSDTQVAEPAEPVLYVPLENAPSRGGPWAETAVTIVVFSDFECPYCAKAAEAIDRVMLAHAGRVRLVFRHFPLPNHDRAIPMAIASIWADREDLFWQMHDQFFQGPLGRDDAQIESLLRELGVPVAKPFDLLADRDAIGRLEEDVQLGQALGVQGTPTFFVNGIRVEGLPDDESLDQMVAEQIRLADALQAETGLSGVDLYQAMVYRNDGVLGGSE